ncbi:MAG: class I SAM-dependent DNA methyltransferase [Cellulosilyticaceae bacterium]
MVEIYNDFAAVYDSFMEDTPYERWMQFISKTIEKEGIDLKLICDLGCGTGKMCELFAESGTDVIGIDGSYEMLMVARENAMEKELDILYLLQDMSEFELYGTVDVVCSTCDSLNYLTDREKVLSTFKWVNNYLEKGGLFIFDMVTPHKYKNVLGDRVFAQQTEDAAYIWENYYDEETKTNEFGVTFFIEDEDGKYVRTEEVHHQKAYTVEDVTMLIEEAGMELVGVYDDYTDKAYSDTTERMTFVARERAVEGKVYSCD